MTLSPLSFPMPLSDMACKDILWNNFGIIVVNKTKAIIKTNLQSEIIFKSIAGGLIGKDLKIFLPNSGIGEPPSDSVSGDPQGKATKSSFGFETAAVRGDGSEVKVWVMVWNFAESGEPYTMIAIKELDGVKPPDIATHQ